MSIPQPLLSLKGADMRDVPETTTLLRLASSHLMDLPAPANLDPEKKEEMQVQQASALALVAIGAELVRVRDALETLAAGS
jgi:hypothetical protein